MPLPIELKDFGNCVHISNIKETSIHYIYPIESYDPSISDIAGAHEWAPGYGWVFFRRNSLDTVGLFGLCRS